MRKALLISAFVIFGSGHALAAPYYTFQRGIMPEADSTYYLGTTTPSTNAWAGGVFDQICLTADTCRTSWPGGTVTSVTGTYPVISSGGATPAISLAFGTTTSNTWAGTQTFTNQITGSISGNAGTATALAGNGTNCSAGSYPLGVDASGASENCTVATTGTVTSVALTVPTGLSVSGSPVTTSGTLALTYATGYEGVLTASTTNWNNFYDLPSSRITAGDALTWSGNTLNFDGGNTPSGDLGGTWASPSVTDDSHNHTGTTLSGIDISSDTNLAGDSEIVLTGDSLSIAASIARDSELHSAVTVTGEDYLSLATQQITANAIDPDNLSASDFGDFTCNGTTCSLDASYQPLDSDLTDLAGLTAAAGDLIYGNGAGDWAKRAATTNGFVLGLSAGIPTWVATTTFSSGLTYLNGNVTADLGTAITSSEITDNEIVNADINSAAAISVSKLALTAGDALTITGDDIDFDGGATPSGDLGGTWASPSVTDDSHAHTGGTISGLDISGDTNLTAGDGLTLTDDDLDCDTASGSVFGCLSAANWTTFNNKQNAISVTWPITLSGATIGFNGLSTSSPIAAESGLLYATGVNTLASVSTSSPISMSITGNAGTATALAANGANCSSGSAPLGVDASGAVESCFDVWTEAENTTAAYTPQTRTLTIAGTANQITSSAGAQDLSANRTWTLSLPNHVIFPSTFQATAATTTHATSTTFGLTGVTNSLLYANAVGSVLATSSVSANYLDGILPILKGGTGTTTAPVSQLLYGGTDAYHSVATTSLSLGLGLSHSGTLGSLVGGSSGSLTIATSSLYSGTTGQVAYFDGTNSLVGTSSIFIDANGSVGIGSTTPYAKLSVTNTGAAPSFIVEDSASPDATPFIINELGNVGIATSSPESRLDVDGVVSVGTPSASAVQLMVYGGSSGGNIICLDRTSGTTLRYCWTLGGGRLSFTDATANETTGQFDWDAVNTRSEVTIGVNEASGAATNANDGLVRAGDGSTSSTNTSGGSLLLGTGRGTGSGALGDIEFLTPTILGSGTTQQSWATRMILTGAGNLGIGSTTPTANLQVTAQTANATTSVEVGKTGQNKGSCLVMYDAKGVLQYVSIQGGVLVVSAATSCR